ncbi:MAG: electron transfer flavoprotein subunit beta/FixA family protein [Planctomycetota bacterium]
MAYNIVVLVKQVPDTKRITGKAMRDDGTVNRSALPAIFNPEDLHALEMALVVREAHGGSVTVITMGPPTAAEVLREALYRGADRVILLSDIRAAASDTLATSYILNCAVRKLGEVDLVFCGRQAIDGDTAQVGPQCAEKLGIPQITYVQEIQSLSDRTIRARRNTDAGFQIVEARLPVLLTVVDAANDPRYPAARRLMRFKRAFTATEVSRAIKRENPQIDPQVHEQRTREAVRDLQLQGLLIEEWNLDTIRADLAWCGRDGSPTKVHRIQSIVLKASATKDIPASRTSITSLVHELIEDHTIG